jgi:hypothetical protein
MNGRFASWRISREYAVLHQLTIAIRSGATPWRTTDDIARATKSSRTVTCLVLAGLKKRGSVVSRRLTRAVVASMAPGPGPSGAVMIDVTPLLLGAPSINKLHCADLEVALGDFALELQGLSGAYMGQSAASAQLDPAVEASL